MKQTTTKRSGRMPAVVSILGVSVATGWRYAKQYPDFPRPRKLSARCTVFDIDEVIAWRDSRMVSEEEPAKTEATQPTKQSQDVPAKAEQAPDWLGRMRKVRADARSAQ